MATAVRDVALNSDVSFRSCASVGKFGVACVGTVEAVYVTFGVTAQELIQLIGQVVVLNLEFTVALVENFVLLLQSGVIARQSFVNAVQSVIVCIRRLELESSIHEELQ